MKKTPWFSGDVKPARPGVYERRYAMGTLFCRYSSGRWFAGQETVEDAGRCMFDSGFARMPWRGLAAPAGKEG